MIAPEPILKGIFRETATGKVYWGYFLKHNADAGESAGDDCFLTLPVELTGGEHNCGESGLFPKSDFEAAFSFLGFPKPGQKFGQ